MRDFTDTAERMLKLVPESSLALRFEIQRAIVSDNYRAPEATQHSWLQLQRVLAHYFRDHEPGTEEDNADWEREICAIMRGEK